MKSRTRVLLPLFLGALIAAGVLWFVFRGGDSNRSGFEGNVGPGAPASITLLPASGGSDEENGGGTRPAEMDFDGKSEAEVIGGLAARIEAVKVRLGDERLDPATALTILGELFRDFREAGPSPSVAAIVAFLESGEDAGTGLEFLVAEGGLLEEAPTLRTALLDQLGQLSAPDAAAYAEKIFLEARNADEWAVNLRNLAWSNEDGRFTGTMGRRLGEMLDRGDWLRQPSAGFVEAFDFSVYLGGQEQVANMASVLSLGPDNGLDHAAFISLDRLTLRDPEMVFDFFEKDGSLMSWSPQVRASLMARAVDPGDAVQRRSLEAYLLDPRTGAAEFAHFARLYPLRSYSIGPRLATRDETFPGLSETARADLDSLERVRSWLKDPRFAARREGLLEIEARLVEFERQIGEARREGSLR